MISIHIPNGKTAPDLNNELSSASNIKNRAIKNTTITGLNKIIKYL